MEVFDLAGRKVETVFVGELNAGNYTLPWHPQPNLENGTYLLKVLVGHEMRSEKLILTR